MRLADLARAFDLLQQRRAIDAQLQALGIEIDGGGPAIELPAAAVAAPIVAREQDKPRAASARAEAQSGASAAVMTWEAALAEAQRRLIPGPARDFAAGKMDQDTFDQWCDRRAGEIEAEAEEIMAGTGKANPARCHCGAASTSVIAGIAYCATHEATAPRPQRPQLVGIG